MCVCVFSCICAMPLVYDAIYIYIYIKLIKIKEKQQVSIKVPTFLADAFHGGLFLTTERG